MNLNKNPELENNNNDICDSAVKNDSIDSTASEAMPSEIDTDGEFIEYTLSQQIVYNLGFPNNNYLEVKIPKISKIDKLEVALNKVIEESDSLRMSLDKGGQTVYPWISWQSIACNRSKTRKEHAKTVLNNRNCMLANKYMGYPAFELRLSYHCSENILHFAGNPLLLNTYSMIEIINAVLDYYNDVGIPKSTKGCMVAHIRKQLDREKSITPTQGRKHNPMLIYSISNNKQKKCQIHDMEKIHIEIPQNYVNKADKVAIESDYSMDAMFMASYVMLIDFFSWDSSTFIKHKTIKKYDKQAIESTESFNNVFIDNNLKIRDIIYESESALTHMDNDISYKDIGYYSLQLNINNPIKPNSDIIITHHISATNSNLFSCQLFRIQDKITAHFAIDHRSIKCNAMNLIKKYVKNIAVICDEKSHNSMNPKFIVSKFESSFKDIDRILNKGYIGNIIDVLLKTMNSIVAASGLDMLRKMNVIDDSNITVGDIEDIKEAYISQAYWGIFEKLFKVMIDTGMLEYIPTGNFAVQSNKVPNKDILWSKAINMSHALGGVTGLLQHLKMVCENLHILYSGSNNHMDMVVNQFDIDRSIKVFGNNIINNITNVYIAKLLIGNIDLIDDNKASIRIVEYGNGESCILETLMPMIDATANNSSKFQYHYYSKSNFFNYHMRKRAFSKERKNFSISFFDIDTHSPHLRDVDILICNQYLASTDDIAKNIDTLKSTLHKIGIMILINTKDYTHQFINPVSLMVNHAPISYADANITTSQSLMLDNHKRIVDYIGDAVIRINISQESGILDSLHLESYLAIFNNTDKKSVPCEITVPTYEDSSDTLNRVKSVFEDAIAKGVDIKAGFFDINGNKDSIESISQKIISEFDMAISPDRIIYRLENNASIYDIYHFVEDCDRGIYLSNDHSDLSYGLKVDEILNPRSDNLTIIIHDDLGGVSHIEDNIQHDSSYDSVITFRIDNYKKWINKCEKMSIKDIAEMYCDKIKDKVFMFNRIRVVGYEFSSLIACEIYTRIMEFSDNVDFISAAWKGHPGINSNIVTRLLFMMTLKVYSDECSLCLDSIIDMSNKRKLKFNINTTENDAKIKSNLKETKDSEIFKIADSNLDDYVNKCASLTDMDQSAIQEKLSLFTHILKIADTFIPSVITKDITLLQTRNTDNSFWKGICLKKINIINIGETPNTDIMDIINSEC